MLGGDKAEVGHQTPGGREAADIVDFTQKCQSGEGFDPAQTTESFDLWSVGLLHGEAFEFGVKGSVLRFEVLEMFEFDGQCSLERAFEGAAELGEPQSVLLGPGGLGLGEDVTMVAQYAGDTMFGASAVDPIAGAQAQESAQGFLVFRWDMDCGKMSTAVEAGKHESIETVRLAAIARFSGNERWSNHIAMEAVVGEHMLENEAGTGGLVAGPDGSFLCEASEELAHLHQIGGEFDHLRFLAVPFKDGNSNRFGMHVKADNSVLDHGWTPF